MIAEIVSGSLATSLAPNVCPKSHLDGLSYSPAGLSWVLLEGSIDFRCDHNKIDNIEEENMPVQPFHG